MPDDRRGWAAMSAEAMREGAVLILVFGLLDKYVLDANGPSDRWILGVFALSLLLFVFGGSLERVRRR